MIKTLLVLSSVLSLNIGIGQSLSGIWYIGPTGTTPLDFLMLGSESDIMEIEVSSDSLIHGVVHSIYSKGRFTHVKVSGIINWKDSSVVIADVKLLSLNVNTKVYKYCYGMEFLKLTRLPDKFVLSGKWKDRSSGIARCPTRTVSWFKSIDNKNEPLARSYDPLRVTDVQEVIEVASEELDSIKCSLYDNGQIDGDTVTVYLDGQVLVSHQRLTEKPIDFWISLKKDSRSHFLKMEAENLGQIPPNTAVMMVTTKKNRYTVSLESNFSKNGTVQLFLKE